MRPINLMGLAILSAVVGCSETKTPKVPDTLLGSWIDSFETADCESVFTFVDDGTFTFSSANERQSGTYNLSIIESVSDAYFLEIDILEDNGLTNCDGEQGVDLEGIDTTARFPDANTLTWSFEGEVVVTFLRDMTTP